MARISGVDVPGNKQAWVSLQYLYGIGSTLSQKILAETKIDPNAKLDSLSDADINRIREVIARDYVVEGDLRRESSLNIKRLVEIGSYRGVRHRRNLPVHGQRTRTNARTRRGPKRTVAGRGQRRGVGKK
ncbi:MAG: 30S ribosomal protein S13 [Chloroflexota bacterium]